jgi:hypothetical protein
MKNNLFPKLCIVALIALCAFQTYYINKLQRNISEYKLSLIKGDEKSNKHAHRLDRINSLKAFPYIPTVPINKSTDTTSNQSDSRELGAITESDRLSIQKLGNMAKSYVTNNLNSHYSAIFDEFGLSEEDQKNLLEHLGNIDSIFTESGQYLIKLQQSRNAYDKKLRSTLSESQYADYLDSEADRYADTEYQATKQYMDKNGLYDLNEKDLKIYKDLLKESGIYVATIQPGPYGNNPEVADGELEVIGLLKKKLEKVEQSSEQILGKAKQMGMSDVGWDRLLDYYSDVYAQTENKIKVTEHRLQYPERHQQIINAPEAEREKLIKQLEMEIGIISRP